MSNVEKLKAWFDDQVKNHGLIDLKLYPIGRADATTEEVAGEVLAMLAAPTCERREEL